jgi:predicted nucleic acid-binding protein
MSPRVFLDSGIFIALLNRRDTWHTQAVALFDQGKVAWCTSYLVVSESYSWFLHRHGEEAGRTFHKLLGSLSGLRVFPATEALHRSVLKKLDELRGCKVSYVDAASLCQIEEHKIKTVWSTDHHLGLTGAEVLPRS